MGITLALFSFISSLLLLVGLLFSEESKLTVQTQEPSPTAQVIEPTPTMRPTPTARPTPTPTFTPTPEPTPTPKPQPMVQVIYAIPKGRLYNERYDEAVQDAILHVQDWYAKQLDGRTFSIEEPSPLVCEVQNESEYFESGGGWYRTIEAVQHCAPVEHSSDEFVWAIYIDAGYDCGDLSEGELGAGVAGITILNNADLKGLVAPTTFLTCPDYHPRGEYGWIGGLAHELGHAFGLEHPPGCDDAYYSGMLDGPNAEDHCDIAALMWWGYYWDYPDTYFTDEGIAILESSPFIRP